MMNREEKGRAADRWTSAGVRLGVRMRGCGAVAAVLAALFWGGVPAAEGATVQVARMISLVVDISGSIDDNEYDLQMQGWADAIVAATGNITSYESGIAFNMVMFSTRSREVIPWTLVDDGTNGVTPVEFATTVAGVERPIDLGNNTRVGRALVATKSALEATLEADDGFRSDLIIVDVSGDGSENIVDWSEVLVARNELLEVADRINALTVGNSQRVFDFYDQHVRGGAGSFIERAAGFDTFTAAAIRKIGRETGGEIPEPGRAMLSLLGLVGGFLFLRRRGRR